MTPRVGRTGAVGVVVPVHNEEELLGAALDAIAGACAEVTSAGIECRTVVVLDGCSDGSDAIARHWAGAVNRPAGPHHAVVLRCHSTGVGNARRLGAAALLRTWRTRDPGTIWLATTDADSRVPRRWLAAQVAAHEGGADVWTGRVVVEDWSPYDDATARLWNAAYDGEEVPVHGASLGCNAQMYLDAGGFAPLHTGEDRALHRALLDAGGRACHDTELRVITSSRRQARAPLGFAHALSSFDHDVRNGALIS